MSPNRPTAALLIAHGSRRREANDDLVRLGECLRGRNVYPIVETAYLELAEPTIPQAGRRCVERGAGRVLMLPYFLSAGAHVVEDLEHHRRELAAQFPTTDFRLCPPLGRHPLLVEIVLARLAEGDAQDSI